jgi:hypothetical protein
MSNPAFAIYERIAEVQALLHDHVECGKHTAADVVAHGVSHPVGKRAAYGCVGGRTLSGEYAAR